jgi:type I restriction enzyme S subunit
MARDYLIGDFLKRIKRPVELVADKDYKLVTIKMNHNGIVLRGTKKGSDIKSKMYEVKEGDFILSGIDARNGAFGIIPKDLDGAIVTNDFWYFEIDEKVISKRLFLELTATTWFDDICKKGSDGTTQRIRLQKNKFFNQQILLPEGDEQEKLLSTILEFKKGQNGLMKEVEIQNQLLTQLKQSILQEAIQGKLTADWRKQNPNTEPASEILNRIKSVKAQLIKDKKIKKEKALPSITEEEIPFELPAGWLWCRMQNYLDVRDGTHNTPKYVSQVYLW